MRQLTQIPEGAFDPERIHSQPPITGREMAVTGVAALVAVNTVGGLALAEQGSGLDMSSDRTTEEIELEPTSNAFRGVTLLTGSYEVSYTVRSGDQLNELAVQFGVDASSLGFQGDPDMLPVGTELRFSINNPYAIQVNAGDTYNELAASLNVPLEALRSVNDDSDLGSVQAIIVPVEAYGGYMVQEGDRLSAIAEAFGLSVESLASTNAIADIDLIYDGQQLIIPRSPVLIGEESDGDLHGEFGFNIETEEDLSNTEPGSDQGSSGLEVEVSPAPEPTPQPTPETEVAPPPSVPQPKPEPVELEVSPYGMNPEKLEDLGLLKIPNLGPKNSEGYHRMPVNSDLYVFSKKDFPFEGMSGTPKSSRCASEETLSHAFTVAATLPKKLDHLELIYGDFNEGIGHVSHRNGVDYDVYDVGGLATSVVGNPKDMLALAKHAALTGDNMMASIFYGHWDTIEEFNKWAAKKGLDVRMSYEDNHDYHMHFRMKSEYGGSYSVTCAPNTEDYKPKHAREYVESQGPTLAEYRAAAREVIDGLSISDAQKKFYTKVAARLYDEYAEGAKINPEIAIAQALLESNWGRSDLSEGHNFFGMTAGSAWTGETETRLDYVDGKLVPHEFRIYDSFKDGVEGYINFVRAGDHYRDARKAHDDPDWYLAGLLYDVKNGQKLPTNLRWADDPVEYTAGINNWRNVYKIAEIVDAMAALDE